MTSESTRKRTKSGEDSSSMSKQGFRVLGLLSLLCILLVMGSPVDLEEGETYGASSLSHGINTASMQRSEGPMVKRMAAPMMESAEFAFAEDAGEMAMPASGKMGSFSGSLDINHHMELSLQELQSKTYVTSRMLIKSGSMWIEVTNVADTVATVLTILDRYPEGFIESKSQSRSSSYHGRIPAEQGVHLRARVPSEQFDAILESIQQAVGKENVKSMDTNSRDVTDQYVDAASRADVLDASRKALQTLLDKAQNVREVMEVQRELNRIVEQYESQKKRAESLKAQSSLSTLSIDISARLSPTPRRDGFIPSKMVQRALHDIGKVSNSMGNTLVYYAVIFVPLALVFVVLRLLFGKPGTKWFKADRGADMSL